MAYPAVTVSNSAHRPGAIRAIYVKRPDYQWSKIGGITAASLSFPNFEEDDSFGRNSAFAFDFKAEAEMTQGKLTELELLATICDGTSEFLFELADAATLPLTVAAATEGWVYLTAAQANANFSIPLGGGVSKRRKPKLEWSGSLKLSELAAAVKGSLAQYDLADTTSQGPIGGICVYTSEHDGGQPNRAHEVSNALTSVELAETGGAFVNIGSVKNLNLILKGISRPEDDERNRHAPFALDIAGSFEWQQTDAADLLNIASALALRVDVRFTFADGLIVTLSDNSGISTEYSVPKTADEKKFVKFMHKGKVPLSILATILSGS